MLILGSLYCQAANREGQPQKELPDYIHTTLNEIQGDKIISHARVLCKPFYRGRAAGTPAERKAANYIADEFRRMGLRPGGSAGGFYQRFKIAPGYQITSSFEIQMGQIGKNDFQRGRDYRVAYLPREQAEITSECVLAGYGLTIPVLNFDEYQDIHASGKAVIVFAGVPWTAKRESWILPEQDLTYYNTLSYKAENAAAHGAACLVIVDNPVGWRKDLDFSEQLQIPEKKLPLNRPIPIINITHEVLTEITTMDFQELQSLAQDIIKEKVPQSLPLRGRILHLQAMLSGSAQLGRNIIAVLPGGDSKLRQEAVVLGAHYDHLGMGDTSIYFGANDNAAGVGALLMVAQAFAHLPNPPQRTLIFVAFDAEEIGKMGSRYYVANPPLAIEQTVLMINFDMIGRNDPNSIYAVGTRSSSVLHQIHQEMNQQIGLNLVHPGSFRLGRSDHTPFYYANVPIMYLFGGLDPDYNTPRDTWDKLIPGKVEKVARLSFLTAWAVAQMEQRLKFIPAD